MNFYEIEPEKNHFHTLLADVTHKCQMSCANCYIPNREIPDMDIDKLESFIKRLPHRTDIRLIGAEATLRKDLPDIIYMLRQNGHRPTLLTNGLKLASENYCKTLWNYGLRSLGISMNGGDKDDIYDLIDKGRYAKKKVQALENLIKLGFLVHINCILIPKLNEDIPLRLLKLIEKFCLKYQKTSGNYYPLMLRFKNVGQIGRYMKEPQSFEIDKMLKLLFKTFDINESQVKIKNEIDGFSECKSYFFSIPSQVGKIFVKVTDWRVDDDGVPDAGSKRRGRITQNFKIAPFFEHVKRNEYGY
ncbi:MAG: radical SAM protein [Bdellovibrionales bacterium]|nr:radical SAM protein [Bdellovibrionales bacterium]